MLRNLIVLPDGTEIFSGVGTVNAIQSTTLTEIVNSGPELTLGSVCASMLEMKLITPDGGLRLSAGDELTLYKVPDSGDWAKIGPFTLETPARPSKNTFQLTAYDRTSWLDRDLSTWFASLDGWPYALHTLARMTCEACGLTLVTEDIPNGDFTVDKFHPKEVTGRRLMEWIGQIACRFVRATPDGEIEFAWYTPSGVTLTPNGARYYSGLRYEGQVAPIDAVQIRINDGESALCLPMAEEGANCYIIEGNPMLTGLVEQTQMVLENIRAELAGFSYTPCRVSIPACLDIHAGQTVDIIDPNGNTFMTCVMQKIQKGQRDTIESTGSARRDSSTASHNQSVQAIANRAVEGQTQMDIFNRLTRNGADDGIWLEDGHLYINAAILRSGLIKAVQIGLSGKLEVYDGEGGVKGGYMGYLPGSTNTGRTDGIGVSNADDSCYVLATDAGVRVQAGNTMLYLVAANGQIALRGTVDIQGKLLLNGVEITAPTTGTETEEGTT
ncbi:MAG: hypothetical protein IJ960_06715 [Oscillospiraceae bacterium]|nr:hypothetical protein [Oscillospiraceae bacterium]